MLHSVWVIHRVKDLSALMLYSGFQRKRTLSLFARITKTSISEKMMSMAMISVLLLHGHITSFGALFVGSFAEEKDTTCFRFGDEDPDTADGGDSPESRRRERGESGALAHAPRIDREPRDELDVESSGFLNSSSCTSTLPTIPRTRNFMLDGTASCVGFCSREARAITIQMTHLAFKD
ncbi:hypothetical protein B0H11DRAFT_2200286 [Mycena galericulata]|nr:hypothetical protein B0H11DRAFT_2200286 [Mycena galericulata]